MDGSKNETTANSTVTPEKTAEQRARRFIGSFNHSLDSKGRLVIEHDQLTFERNAIYPTEKWEERNETYERLGKLNPALNRYLEQFYALSFDEQTCDAQGRVLLPANIRQKILHDERDMEITGANDHVRVAAVSDSGDIWNRFKEELPQLLEMIAGLEASKE